MSYFLSWIQKKPVIKETTSINITVAGKKFPLKKDPNLRCVDLCRHFAGEFVNREKQGRTVDLRVMMIVESKKDKGVIVSKRVLSPFERLFDESFQEYSQKAIFKYFVIDMDEFPKTTSQYLSIIQHTAFQPMREGKVEREGILQMRVAERHGSRSNSSRDKKSGFEKKRFVLTQDDLIYCDKKDDKNISCIPLLCIEDIYVHDLKKDKYENVWFFLNTASETYTIKCNSDLDYDLWINSLIHCTNLAKESNILKERNKKIEQVQSFLFELSSKNSIFDTQFVMADRRQLERAFDVIEAHCNDFFPKYITSADLNQTKGAAMLKPLKDFTTAFLDARRLKNDPSASDQFKAKIQDCVKLLDTHLESQDGESTTLAQVIGADPESADAIDGRAKEVFDRISKVVDDMFYNLQRLSVSNNVFLEQYYSRLEGASLSRLDSFIV